MQPVQHAARAAAISLAALRWCCAGGKASWSVPLAGGESSWSVPLAAQLLQLLQGRLEQYNRLCTCRGAQLFYVWTVVHPLEKCHQSIAPAAPSGAQSLQHRRVTAAPPASPVPAPAAISESGATDWLPRQQRHNNNNNNKAASSASTELPGFGLLSFVCVVTGLAKYSERVRRGAHGRGFGPF